MPADQWRRLAFGFAVSLVLHALAFNVVGPAGVPAAGSAANATKSGITVILATTTTPLPVQSESGLNVVPAPEIPPLALSPMQLATIAPAPYSPAPKETAPSRTIQPSIGLSGIVSGPWYYPARYLHRRPTPLKPIRPPYPAAAGNQAGKVVLLLFINEQGTVDNHRVMKSEPDGLFENAVVPPFIAERYAPGLITGQAVKSQLLVEVSFEPGTEARVSVLAEPAQQ